MRRVLLRERAFTGLMYAPTLGVRVMLTSPILSTMKPDTSTAMRQLIVGVRKRIPFAQTGITECPDSCQGCSVKLLEFLYLELDRWEGRLNAGDRPGLADISRLAATSRKIYRTLQRNGLVT